MLNRRPRRSMSQMNVVPYIDVMLVLLVIFMVTTPMFSPGVINLPSVGKAAQIETEPVQVLIDDQGRYSDSDKGSDHPEVSLPEHSAQLDSLTGGDRQRPVVISGDKTVAYEKVMEVMRELQQRGYARIGLLVKTES